MLSRAGFDAAWYLEHYPDVARAGIDPWQHYQQNGVQEGRLPCRLESLELDTNLWRERETAEHSLSLLRACLQGNSHFESSYAAFALGRWYAWRGEWQMATDVLVQRERTEHGLPAHLGPDLLTVEALTRSGRLSEAWRYLGTLIQRAPESADGALAVSNWLAACADRFSIAGAAVHIDWHAQRLRWINQTWQRNGLLPIGTAKPGETLVLDHLICPAMPSLSTVDNVSAEPLVSVIVPAFNAGQSLLTALNSLADQTLARRYPGALEVIVIDDASTDDTLAIARTFVGKTPGFRLLCQPHNAGAYAARNRGLSQARGQCITVHDADDWSHPQKLEQQWLALQDHPEWMACNSHWVRCDDELIFSRWRMEEGWVYRNTSSLMFRRQVVDEIGYWDQVRVEADTEFYYRIRAAYGAGSTGDVLPGVPLAFGRVVQTALTVLPETHVVTQFSGVRAEYRKAAFAWHEQAKEINDLYVPFDAKCRPFPAPDGIMP